MYSHWVKDAIHIRFHPENINRDSGAEIPEERMLTIRKHSSQSLPQGTAEGTDSSSINAQNALDQNQPTNHKQGSGYTSH